MNKRLCLLCLLWAGGCARDIPGHEQHLHLKLAGTLPGDVIAAQITVAAAELLPCEDRVRWIDLAGAWLVPTARAHSESGALRIGTPHVISLLGEAGTRIELGRFTPPPGDYCEIALTLVPADEDAVGLPPDGGAAHVLHMRFADDRADWIIPVGLTTKVELHPPLTLDTPVQQSLTIELDRTRWWAAEPQTASAALYALLDALRHR